MPPERLIECSGIRSVTLGFADSQGYEWVERRK